MYIGAFSQRAGTSIKTIRYYEAIGLLPQPAREGRYRVYDDTYIETVRQIRLAQSLGFTLKQIQSMCADEDIRRGLPRHVIEKAIALRKQAIATQMMELQRQSEALEEVRAMLNC